jgi:hypothetical protein
MLSTLTSTRSSVSASYRLRAATCPQVCGLEPSVRAVQLTYAMVFFGVEIAAMVATTFMNATVARELLTAVATSEWTIQSCEHF